MHALAALLAFQLQVPAPVGYVNDFARVIDPASAAAIQRLIDEVRDKSGGEIVVVTLRDLGGQAAIDIGRDIGRSWGVGAQGGAGASARNAGVVLLLKPGQRPGDGQAELAVASGTGAEGFVTDALAGQIRDAVGREAVRQGSYAAGLAVGVQLLAAAYAREFGFELTGAAQRREPAPGPRGGGGFPWPVLLIVLVVVLSAGRRRRMGGGLLEAIFWGSVLGGGRRGGGWGGGGFGGGGFGGFGDGGGFGGGGASGRF